MNFLLRDLEFPILNFDFGVFLQTPNNFTKNSPIQLLPEISYFESGRAAPGDRSNLGLDRADLPGRGSKFEKKIAPEAAEKAFLGNQEEDLIGKG